MKNRLSILLYIFFLSFTTAAHERTLNAEEISIDKCMEEILPRASNTANPPLVVLKPFLASWMKYAPAEVISEFEITDLISQGTRDFKAKEEKAKILYKSPAHSKLVLLKDRNHVFKEIKEEEKNLNLSTYTHPEKPLHPKLISVVTDFIKNLEKE